MSKTSLKNKFFWLLFCTGFFSFIALGIWQYSRYIEKKNLNHELQKTLQEPATKLPSELNDDLLDKKVIIDGLYLNDREILIENKFHNNQPGYFLVTPLLRTNGNPILVNRGWIPVEKKDSKDRPYSLLNQITSVEGILKKKKPQKILSITNQPNDNIWYFIDTSQMKEFLSFDVLEDYYIEILHNPNDKNIPIGVKQNTDYQVNHFGYMLTWFILAFSLLIFLFIYIRSNKSNTQNS